MQSLERRQDDVRVAINVGANLKNGDTAVAAGQWREQRLRRRRRRVDRTPGQLLEAQRGAYLLGECRQFVVMQDDLGHDSSSRTLLPRGIFARQYMMCPPSTMIVCPETKPARSDSRETAVPTRSSGFCSRDSARAFRKFCCH